MQDIVGLEKIGIKYGHTLDGNMPLEPALPFEVMEGVTVTG